MQTLLMVIFVVDVILLIVVILMQSGSGADAGMFGSSLTMGAFGAKTSETLTNFTRWLVAIFMLTALLLGYLKVREYKAFTQTQNSTVQQPQKSQQSQPANQGQATSTAPAEQQGDATPLKLPTK